MKWSLQKLLLVSILICFCGGFLIFIGIAMQYQLNLSTTVIQFLIQLGGVLIGAGLVGIFIEYATMNDLIERVSARIDEINKMEIEDFYEDRTKLPPLKDELKDYNVIWAAWHTGGTSSLSGLISEYKDKTVKLILMDPNDEETIKSVSQIAGEPVEQLKYQIKECTKKAQEIGITVKWYKGPIMHSVIIANPEPVLWKKSWARIEFLIPFEGVIKRPSMKVSNYRGIETLKKFKQWHTKMWNESEEPSLT